MWDETQDHAFSSLTQAMSKPAVLAFPKSDGLFIIDTDASDHSLGAEFLQVQNGREVTYKLCKQT